MATTNWRKTGVNNLVRHGNGTYYARFRVGGKEKWKSLHTKLKEVAKNRLADLLKEAKSARRLANAEDGKITFGQLIEIRLEQVDASAKLKPATKLYWRETFTAVRATWEGIDSIQARDGSAADFEAWANRAEVRYSATRYNNMLSGMRAVLKIARKKGVIFGDPTEDIKRASVKPKKPDLPDLETFEKWLAEIDRVVGRGGDARGELVRFLAYSGLRCDSEARWVTWGDVKFDAGIIKVNGHPETSTKGGEAREVPLNPKLHQLLRGMRDARQDEPADSRVLRVFEAQKSMDRAAKVVGMARLTRHDLRHWFTTRCIESGVDVPTVADWLGHKDGGVLLMRTYRQHREEHSRAAAKKVTF